MEQANDRDLAPLTRSLDVMGDGSLVLLPTPGHTARSMSLLVRRTGKPPLLMMFRVLGIRQYLLLRRAAS